MRISQIHFEWTPDVVAHWYFVVEGPPQVDASSRSESFSSCLLPDRELRGYLVKASGPLLQMLLLRF